MKRRQKSNNALLRETTQRLIFETPAPYVSAQSWCVLDRTTKFYVRTNEQLKGSMAPKPQKSTNNVTR